MLRKIIIVLAILVITVCLAGCKKSSTPPPAKTPEEVKSTAEYEAQAKKEINKDNMASELDKIEQEMKTEEAAEGL